MDKIITLSNEEMTMLHGFFFYALSIVKNERWNNEEYFGDEIEKGIVTKEEIKTSMKVLKMLIDRTDSKIEDFQIFADELFDEMEQ